MSIDSESTDRKPTDLILFGLGFIGFLMIGAGIVATTPGLALTGSLLFMIVVLSFWLRSSFE